MALAVKNASEAPTQSLFDRLTVASLIGLTYVLGSIGVVFYATPWLWGEAFPKGSEIINPFVSGALMIIAMLTAGAGLSYLGARLVNFDPAHGLRAGIFVAGAGLAAIALLTWIVGEVMEAILWRWEGTSAIGVILTAAVGFGLLFLAGRKFLRPGTEERFRRIEDQGWFSLAAYKKSQGLRVRRGTMLGILFLAGSGIWVLDAHKALYFNRSKDMDVTLNDWRMSLPFGTGTIRTRGDAELPGGDLTISWGDLHRANQLLEGKVRVSDPGDSTKFKFKKGELVPTADFDTERKTLTDKRPPVSATPAPAEAEFPYVKLLADVRFTVPLLLTAVALWFAYRIVNWPAFADFLIATEAELNKVSWTSRKRLYQDTIVVLTTVVLLTVFLFLVDIAWGFLLSKVGVLQSEPPSQQQGQGKEQPW